MDTHPPPPTLSETEREYREILARANVPPEDMLRLKALLDLELERRLENDAVRRERERAHEASSAPPLTESTASASVASAFTYDQVAHLLSLAAAQPATPRLAEAQPPPTFLGKSEEVEPFLSAARRWISMAPQKVPTLRSKLMWSLSFFAGSAEPWQRDYSDALARDDPLPWNTWAAFEDAVRLGFGAVARTHEAQQAIHTIRMRSKESLNEFVTRFMCDAKASEFNDASLITYFRNAIPAATQKEIASLNGGAFPLAIDAWYRFAQTLDRVNNAIVSTPAPAPRTFSNTPRAPAPVASTPTSPSTSTSDAMDVDAHRVRFSGTCYNCGKHGHRSANCREPRKTRGAFLSEEELLALRALIPKKADFPVPQQ